MRALILGAQLVLAAAAVPIVKDSASLAPGVVAAHLRGSAGEPTGVVGDRGHFYYAEKCSDCVYKEEEQCGCQPVVEYLACVTKHCHNASHPAFGESCRNVQMKCTSDLDIDCSGPETACKSKWNQLHAGGLGLSVHLDKDSAFCGPFGKCLGKIHIDVDLHNRPKPPPAVAPAVVASPAPAPASSPAVAGEPVVPVAPVQIHVGYSATPVWLECGISKGQSGNVDKREDWTKLCQVEVFGEHARCTMPRFDELKVGDKKTSYCVLTDSKNGKRLTQPQFSAITNNHKAAPLAKAEKKTKVEEKKAKVDEKKPKEAEKPQEAHLIQPEEEQLPWMVEKEKRQAARKAEEAQKAPEPKEPKKAPVEPSKKAAAVAENDSQLPWMKGKPAPEKVLSY